MYDIVMTNDFRTGSHERKKYDKNSHGCFQKYGDLPVHYVKKPKDKPQGLTTTQVRNSPVSSSIGCMRRKTRCPGAPNELFINLVSPEVENYLQNRIYN